MATKILNVTALCLLLGACGGGSDNTTVRPVTAPAPTPTPAPTEVDNRIPFAEYSFTETLTYHEEVTDPIDVETTVTFRMGDFVPSSQFNSTDEYKIADYGFFEVYTQGAHYGSYRNPLEPADPAPWEAITNNVFHATDFNRDGHEDFYMAIAWQGARDDRPKVTLFAFVNNGHGNFYPDKGLFEGHKYPCMGGGDLDVVEDPYSECGNTRHWQRTIFADFDGDGIDDVFVNSQLYLSNNGVITDASHTNLPEEFFVQDNGIWSHDNAAGDLDNDGDIDIIIPQQHDNWLVLYNDGAGKFTMLPIFTEVERFTQPDMLWATTITIADVNNDGLNDIVTGWFNPVSAGNYPGWNENSAGVAVINAGTHERGDAWWSEMIPLPASYYGDNGNANDMESIDFNNDGLIDIVVASTRKNPDYKGRAVQFFMNIGSSFVDVTEQYNPDIALFDEHSVSEPNWGNGEGILRVQDFDGDGDLDIVDSNYDTYVLINQQTHFDIKFDFPVPPSVDHEANHPIHINNDGKLDFIAKHNKMDFESGTSVNSFYQVLSK